MTTGVGKPPPPPPPPLPLSKKPTNITILPRDEASASSKLGSPQKETLTIDQQMRIALDRYREDLTPSSDEEEEYDTDSWDEEDND